MTEKEKLITWLSSIQNNFMLGMAAIVAFEREESWSLLDGVEYLFIPKGKEPVEENVTFRLPVYYVGEALRKPELRKTLLLDFRESLLRTTLGEALEHIREYCEATNQQEKLLKTDWYNFARVLRNALRHDGIIWFDKKARPPLVFKKWRIDRDDEGKHISELHLIPSTTAIEILQAIHDFAARLE